MRHQVLALSLVLAAAPRVSFAQDEPPKRLDAEAPPERPERVPLGESFSAFELAGIGALGAVALGAHVFSDDIVSARGQPLIGGPPALDEQISDTVYDGPDSGRFLAGVPDWSGAVGMPVLTLGYYALDAGVLWTRGRGLGGDPHADHELLALLEGYTVTLSLTRFAKLLGRDRPAYALDRPERQEGERTLSFFSGHTSSSFALMSFVYRDLSDWLTSERLAGRSGAERFWLGRFAPAVLLYGAASLVGYSRIEDQQHFTSDVLLGALVGGAAGNLFYALHFDRRGRPRGGHKSERRLHLQPQPMAGGGVGLSLSLR